MGIQLPLLRVITWSRRFDGRDRKVHSGTTTKRHVCRRGRKDKVSVPPDHPVSERKSKANSNEFTTRRRIRTLVDIGATI